MEFNVSENTFLFQDFLLKVFLRELSIQKLLQQKLYTVVSSLCRQGSWISNSNELSLDFTVTEITLSRLKAQIGYRCAVALQLARQQDLCSFFIAKQLVSGLTTVCSDISDRPQLDFTVRVKESGWIEFRPSDRALAIWLQEGLQKINFLEQESLQEIIPHFFNLQYAHARCCSLLRLGHREGLIQLHQMQWKDPYPIPLLDKDGNFRLNHLTEIDAIGQIIEVIDAFASEKTNNWIKLATQLSEAVLECDRFCRILGQVKQNTPELSQARLSLYAIAQLLLQKLLQEKIKIWAPVKL